MGQLIRFWKFPEVYNRFLLSSESEFERFIFEKYQRNNNIRGLKFFYTVKPLLPRPLQIHLRRVRAKSIDNKFPHWPIESYLEDFKREILKNQCKDNKIPFIWFWPDNKKFVFCLTHDVETSKGLKNIEKIVDIEKKHGFRSSFFFVSEDYYIPKSLIFTLKKDGFEIGIHGLRHDGRLFNSYKIFQSNIKKIKKYADDWNALGFRSPSLLRNTEWMKELPFSYDSSFPDIDPYGPQPGGCLSIFPYFLGNLVELPITLPQDHTLFEILQQKDIVIWKRKIDWLEKMNGMVLLIVHPDYINRERLKLYEEVLEYILEKSSCWSALPRDINEWWRKRDVSKIGIDNNNFWIEGPAAIQGTLRMLEEIMGERYLS